MLRRGVVGRSMYVSFHHTDKHVWQVQAGRSWVGGQVTPSVNLNKIGNGNHPPFAVPLHWEVQDIGYSHYHVNRPRPA